MTSTENITQQDTGNDNKADHDNPNTSINHDVASEDKPLSEDTGPSPSTSPSASKLLPLLRRNITLESALDEEENILQELTYPKQRFDFYVHLIMHERDIEAIVSDHLGLEKTERCRIGEVEEWIAGSFNLCIPVYIDSWRQYPGKRVMIRFPLPYKVGESNNPGNAEEKLRCEAATYIWIQEYCPAIRIPYLWGFGFPDGQSFITLEKAPFYARWMWYFRMTALSIFKYPIPCQYIRQRRPGTLKDGYLIMEYIEETDGKMLSKTWEEGRHDKDRRTNLFQGLSRILLSLAQIPLPRIGSFTVDDRGFLSLTNRPLTYKVQHLENEGIPTNIDRNLTYSTTDSYFLDLLAYHDSRIRNQPNSILDESDGQAQLAALTAMRACLPHFVSRDLRHGPFYFTHTDLHQSNIFVDDDWHVRCLVDLEWACSLPMEMLRPPYWLTSRGVDQLQNEHLDAYRSIHEEFVDAFEKEERLLSSPANGDSIYRTEIMRRGWEIGNFWYFHALESTKGLYNLFYGHIQPKFVQVDESNLTEFQRTVAPYWSVDALEVIATKINDKEVYENQLRKAFENPGKAMGS